MIRKSGQRLSEKIVGKQTAEVASISATQRPDETGETSIRMFALAQNLSSASLHLKAEVENFRDRARTA
jgi:methyl-accepting chemotaxis protein